jgi:hydroxyacylglutathione hydrolase
MTPTITALPAFQDNYIWTWQHDQALYVVDPGDSGPVLQHMQDQGLPLAGILVTHHHPDHVGGIAKLRAQAPAVKVYGPADSPFKNLDHRLRDGDTIHVGGWDFALIATPGHTLDHICYYHPQALFCGDTLFAMGCGRLFEGSPEQMWASLSKLSALPTSTPVYCTHEYTLANAQFAKAVSPGHAPTLQRVERVAQLRAEDRITLPSSIGEEQSTNPFLRSAEPAMQSNLREQGWPAETAEQCFASLRRWKDQF